MANKAAQLIAEGVVAQSSNVDVVFVQGYGFPRWEGGLVFWARQQDRSHSEVDLKQLTAETSYEFMLVDLNLLF